MAIDYVLVVDEESEYPIELPTEENGNLLLSTVTAQFPGASGLKYKVSVQSRTFRGVRLSDGVLHPPADEGWDNIVFCCVYPKENKRKHDDALEAPASKVKRLESKLNCTDLIVLGLPYKSTEKELKRYFEKYGELLVVQLKTDKEGRSKGYGFIRFAKYECQIKVLSQRHMIEGRWCDVKIPNSKEGSVPLPRRVYVGRLTEDITAEDVRQYFEKFGQVTDVYMPKDFRAFCFVTFLDPEIAQALCGEDHIIKGSSVYVSDAAPKNNSRKPNDTGEDNNNFGPSFKGNNFSNENDRFNGNDRDQNNFNNQGGNRGGPTDIKNFGPLMNPAFFAAALSQAASWGLMRNFAGGSNIASGRSNMMSSGGNMGGGGGNMGGGGRNMDSGGRNMGGGGRNMDNGNQEVKVQTNGINIHYNRPSDFNMMLNQPGRSNMMSSGGNMGGGGRNMDSGGRNMGGGGRNMDNGNQEVKETNGINIQTPNGSGRSMFNNSNDTSWGWQQNRDVIRREVSRY
ncbi:TAR DNA-binding protein 43 isoform X1 [Diabrotica virgifera virgifera]|uniref:RRM domain-containing protein n=1 Tax=Diabrotica virgifera virgifera TaxID=50390 RepID=A0ABM5KSE4_DIAVI|nr:TAR DNA-binding protein 43 isoform X1 [Diabrotica virgifera virgifera]